MQEHLSGEFDPKQYKTVLDIMRFARQNHGDRPAYSCFSQTLTYADIDRYSDNFAVYLQTQTSLQAGDRIAIQLPNLLQFPIALFGALKAGLVVVSTNPLYTTREMRHQFVDAKVQAVVILENFCEKLEAVIGDTEITHVFVTRLGDLQAPVKRMIMNFGIKYLKKLVPAYQLASPIDFQVAITAPNNSSLTVTPCTQEGDDIALILYTGGTTGYAKGVMLSHNNLIANMMQLRKRCLEIITDRVESILAPLPLYHSYAFLFHCVLLPYAGNHSLLVPNPRDLDTVIAILEQKRVTGFVGINTLYLALLQHKDIGSVDFSDLGFCGAGGMPLTQSVVDEWEQLVGCKIFEGYGLTECSPVVAVNSPSRHKTGSVGLVVADTEIKVVGDDGEEVEQGAKGELLIRGPQVMIGYWNRQQDTDEVLSEDGWFKSGDYVQIDSEGYIKIVDRKKDMILVSGFNVVPGEIEEYVNTHPHILESAVIGIPDSRTGEAVVLYVVSKQDTITEQELKTYCKKGLTGYKLPKDIVFMDELPKSNIGKVLRRELRDNHTPAS
jgi:long-chain acyl-CoA synthetase